MTTVAEWLGWMARGGMISGSGAPVGRIASKRWAAGLLTVGICLAGLALAGCGEQRAVGDRPSGVPAPTATTSVGSATPPVLRQLQATVVAQQTVIAALRRDAPPQSDTPTGLGRLQTPQATETPTGHRRLLAPRTA